MSPPPDVGQAASDLTHSLGRLVNTLGAYGQSRLREVNHAVTAEKRRWVARVVVALAALMLLFLGMLFAGAAVIIAFWDTHRVLAASLVGGGLLLLAGGAGWWLWYDLSRGPSVFDWAARMATLLLRWRRRR